MYDKISMNNQLCPDTLFDMSLRLVNKDINNIPPNMFQCLPSYIKRNILKYSTGYLFRRLKDDEILKALLNNEVKNLKLTNSITTDYTLQNISEICTGLQELILGGAICTFTEMAFHNFIPSMKYLTFLSVKSLPNVTDKSLRGLTELKHLKRLNLKGCLELTDDSGQTLRNLKLERLDMSYTVITDNWLGMLEDSPLNENLVDLNISFCENLTSKNLKVLNWSKLKYVGLFGLNDSDFMENIGKIKNLQWTIPN